jgi:hypothetical protein
MAGPKPTLAQQAKAEFWSLDRCRRELRERAVQNHTEWVMFLLQRTDYQNMKDFLDPKSWGKLSPREWENLTEAVAHVLGHVHRDHLPPGDHADILPAFKRATLKSKLPPGGIKVRKKAN